MSKVSTGIPSKNGMYVAYIKNDSNVEFPYPDKLLLLCVDGVWGYPGSDQKYRTEVLGYVGPLPMPSVKALEDRKDVKYAIGTRQDGKHGSFIDGPYDYLQEALEVTGEKGNIIFKLVVGEAPIILKRWRNKKGVWK